MLRNRILSTLKFFDLQDYPLTLLELHRFLVEEKENLEAVLDEDWEIGDLGQVETSLKVSAGEILNCVENECQNEIYNFLGFYYLTGRKSIVISRLDNYIYGIEREKLIKKYIKGLRFLPFVRGVALAGSQAMGQQKKDSDIDLLIITAENFLGLPRFFITAYFQVLGLRRHGKRVVNRFCLNHYLAGPIKLNKDRNLYTAFEYIKLRPLLGEPQIYEFQKNNHFWLMACFPNLWLMEYSEKKNRNLSAFQNFTEKIFLNKFGAWLEKKVFAYQFSRIQKGEFIVAQNDELSFHPQNRKLQLFKNFF